LFFDHHIASISNLFVPETPSRDTLDVWPLPLLLRGGMTSSSGADDIIVALAAMQVPFPDLVVLRTLVT
jgi:hypothetical protein